MPEERRVEQLDQVIEALLTGREPIPAVDPELRPLLEVARSLSGLPRPEFKARLKRDLEMKARTVASAAAPVRRGFSTVTPYIMVSAALEMVEFVKQAFEAEQTFQAIGSAGGYHTEVRIGDSMLMIGGGGQWRGPERPAALRLYVPDVDEVFERTVELGATSIVPPSDQHYGDRDSALKDPFGNRWYIATRLGGGSFRHEGLGILTPYFLLKGAPEFIDFLKRAFAAEQIGRFDSPEGRVLHASLKIGDSIFGMGEPHGPFQPMPTGLYLYVDDADAWYERALTAGATPLWPPKNQPYGDRVGGVQDPFGNEWFLATHIEQVAGS